MLPNVLMYSTATCPYCERARALLRQKQVAFSEIRIDEFPEMRADMISKSHRHTVPQIFINGQAIGGSDDLHALEQTGQLDKLLQG